MFRHFVVLIDTCICKGDLSFHSSPPLDTHLGLILEKVGFAALIWRWVQCLTILQHPTLVSTRLWSTQWTMGDPTPECLEETSRLRVKDLQCQGKLRNFPFTRFLCASHVPKSYFLVLVYMYTKQMSWSPRSCYYRNSLNPWKSSHGSLFFFFSPFQMFWRNPKDNRLQV